nr:DNA-binding protein [uncultured Desulfobacter sp.]
MATRLVEQEHVSKACNYLVRAGEEPSTLKVRKMLGKGSHSTIQKFIKAWKESEEGQAIHVENLPAVVDLPDEFKEGADLFVKQIFKLAGDHHAAITEQIKQSCDKTIEKSLKEVREAVDYVEVVDQENTDLKDTIEALNQEKASLLGEKSDLEKEKTELSYQVKSLEEKMGQKENELSQAIKARDDLKAQIEDLEGRLNTTSKEIIGYKKEIDLLTTTNGKQVAALTAAQKEINDLSGDLKTCQKELAMAQDSAKKVAEKLDAEKTASRENLSQAQIKNAELTGELKAVKSQLKSALDTAKADEQRWTAELEKANKGVKSGNAKLKAALENKDK